MIAAPIPKLAGGKHSCRPTESEIPPRSQGDGDVYWSDFPEDIFRRLRQMRGPMWWR
jgi:hypothetical protein